MDAHDALPSTRAAGDEGLLSLIAISEGNMRRYLHENVVRPMEHIKPELSKLRQELKNGPEHCN